MSHVEGIGTGIWVGKMGLIREVEGRGLWKERRGRKERSFVGQHPKSSQELALFVLLLSRGE